MLRGHVTSGLPPPGRLQPRQHRQPPPEEADIAEVQRAAEPEDADIRNWLGLRWLHEGIRVLAQQQWFADRNDPLLLFRRRVRNIFRYLAMRCSLTTGGY